MLKKILSVSGRPGLYKLISQGKNMLIVESVGEGKKLPIHSTDKVVSLGDIAMYTNNDEVPLHQVLTALFQKENGAVSTFDYKKASGEELKAYFSEVLPDFDRERVHNADIKKLISWYNLLVSNGYTDFEEKKD